MIGVVDAAALVRFLLARIDEDETELRRLRRLRAANTRAADEPSGMRSLARLRVEFEAKREVICQAQHLLVLRDLPNERDVRDRATQLLRAMAEPYSGHPGYRTQWAVRPATVTRRLAADSRGAA